MTSETSKRGASANRQKPSSETRQRQKIEWSAIERDRRTGQFSLRELEKKYGVDNATIARKIKRDRAKDPNSWQEDLTEAVRQATNTRLMQEFVSDKISEGQHEVSTAVLAAAEANTQVLLRHRRLTAQLSSDAETLRNRLMRIAHKSADTEDELKAVATVAASMEGIGRLAKNLIEKERENFGITSGDGSTKPLRERSDEELIRMTQGFMDRCKAK